jgi:hypothetical protein
MGQYYRAVILAENEDIIRCWLDAFSYDNGQKLMEHSYIGNEYMLAVEHLLSPEGMFYKSRLVWAGDYAENEPVGENLYTLTDTKEPYHRKGDVKSHKYIVNHTKMEYVVKGTRIHPLSLLTAEGNGSGGGDYYGIDEDLVGIWARDIISMEDEIPDGFTELVCGFKED